MKKILSAIWSIIIFVPSLIIYIWNDWRGNK